MSDHFYDAFEAANNKQQGRKDILDLWEEVGFFENPADNIITYPDYEKLYNKR